MAPTVVPRGGLRPVQTGPQGYLLIVLMLLVVVLAFNYWNSSTKNNQLLDELIKFRQKHKVCLDDIRRQKNDILQSERGKDDTRNELSDLNEQIHELKQSAKRHIEQIEDCGRNISQLMKEKRRLERKTEADQSCQELIQTNKNNLEEIFLKEKDQLKQKIGDQTNELQKQQERIETLQKTIETQSIKLQKLQEYQDKEKNNDLQGQQNQDVIQGQNQGRKLKETQDETQYQKQGQQVKERQGETQNQDQGQTQNQNQGQQVKERQSETQNQDQGQAQNQNQGQPQNQNQGQAQDQNQGQQVKERQGETQNQDQGQAQNQNQGQTQNQNQGQAQDQNQGQQVKERQGETQNQDQGQAQNQNQGQAQDQNQGQQVKENQNEAKKQESQQKQNFEKTETSQPRGPTNSSLKIDSDHVPGSRPAHWIEGARRPGDPVHMMQHGSTGVRSADAFTGKQAEATEKTQNGSSAKAMAVDGHKGILSNVQDAGYQEELVGKPGSQEVAGSPGQLGAIKHSNTGESETNKEQNSMEKSGEIIEQNEKGKSALADSESSRQKVLTQE